jgi:nitroreductase
MDLFDCIMGRRTCRRFKQEAIPPEDLERMVDAGRYVPTGYNKQPVRFALVSSEEKKAEAFGFTGWLTGQPQEGQRPAAYIAVCNDNDILSGEAGTHCAVYAVMLAAHALGYQSCWHGIGKKDELREVLGLPANIEPRVLVSLGKPDEKFEVSDSSDNWKVKKGDDGIVRLGKLSKDQVIVASI